MTGASPTRILFTGYAPVHFACFKPLCDRLVNDRQIDVHVSGGLRQKTKHGTLYDHRGLYDRFGLAPDKVLSVEQIKEQDFDVLFAGNTKMILPRSVGMRIQIFHGVSFRNKAVRAENLGADFYFLVGPYMQRAFSRAGLLAPDDPRGLPIGFLKTDRLLNGELDRQALLDKHGFTGERPVVLYAPTGQKHNSLETMGEQIIERLAGTGQYDLLIKPHDHPKKTDIDWFAQLDRLQDHHTRLVSDPDVIPLLFMADLLITDASSVSNEYALLDRPMVFLDVPELIAKARNAKGAMVDLDTWGRRSGPLVREPNEIVAVVERSLEDPGRFSEVRQAIAADLFYNPGTATDAALEWFSPTVALAHAC